MQKEIERKFLVTDLSFKQLSEGTLYRQGYLASGHNSSIRVRVAGSKSFITIKGPINGISRTEYEYAIPLQDANELLRDLCRKPIIEKYRYKLEYNGFLWEIDEFLSENEGLVIAEIELKSEEQQFTKPSFIGDEVTYDFRYHNSNLVNHPYKSW